MRKLGDSNPRYGNPYGSLANCWFQPLTQTSLPRNYRAFALKCGAKVMPFFHSSKFFEVFFSLLLLFSSFLSFSLPSWLFHRPCSTMASPLSSTVASPHGPVCIISSAGFSPASSPCASTDRCRGLRTYGRLRHPASAAIRAQTTPSAGVGQGGKDAPIWRRGEPRDRCRGCSSTRTRRSGRGTSRRRGSSPTDAAWTTSSSRGCRRWRGCHSSGGLP